MFKIISKLALLTAISAMLLQTSLPVLGKPARNQAKPAPAAPAKPADPYDAAKKDLSEDWYVVYRIVDRIARANALDERPWRVIISPEYEINAFATDVNLVAVYNGILDQLGSNASAIACVVGHEMSHHVKRHIAIGQAEKAALTESLQKEAQAEAMREVENAQNDAVGTAVGMGLLGAVGGFFGVPLQGLGAVTQSANQDRFNQAQARIEEITTKKQQELDQRLAEGQRQQEFEADELGYQYIAKAGFDPSGCLQVMEVLGRTPGAEFDTSHPAVPKRIERLRELMRERPAETLAQEGKLYLSTRRVPLTYELSKDGKSLRINSRRGSSASEDLERQFGQ